MVGETFDQIIKAINRFEGREHFVAKLDANQRGMNFSPDKPFDTAWISKVNLDLVPDARGLSVRTFRNGDPQESLGVTIIGKRPQLTITEFVTGRPRFSRGTLQQPIVDRKVRDTRYELGMGNLLQFFNSLDDHSLVWVPRNVFLAESQSLTIYDH